MEVRKYLSANGPRMTPGISGGDMKIIIMALATPPMAEQVIATYSSEVMAVVVGKEAIAFYRVDGEFHATQELCTHEYVSRCGGFVDESPR